MSRSKSGQNHNIFVRIITSPIRALGKAKDLYVRSLTDCAAGPRQKRRRNTYYNNNNAPLPLPRSLSVASSITNIGRGGGEDIQELMRAASVRYYGHQNEAEMYVQQLRQIRQQEREASRSDHQKALPKSVSVGMGFMGRIDEDNACEEFEDDAAVAGGVGAGAGKIDKLGDKYPRSKSYAPVSNRLVVF